jgi:protein phosphatase
MNDIPTPDQPVVTFAEATDPGTLRKENQDSVLQVRTALGEISIVADGMGGYEGGAVASRMVVAGFSEHLASLPADYPADSAIREASALANGNVLAAANAPGSSHRRMGSTVVVALVQQDALETRAWIGHVGDSRAYLVRAGVMSRLTNDHSQVQLLISSNLITPEEAGSHPDASVLTRCLGHHPEVEIDIKAVLLVAGDTLLLCSDGLWGYVAEEDIETVAANPNLTVDGAARAMLDLALVAGGHDNIGIELVRLSAPPVTVPAAVTPPRKRGKFGVLALWVLSLAGLGALAWFAITHHWLDTMLHPQ